MYAYFLPNFGERKDGRCERGHDGEPGMPVDRTF